MYIKRRCDGKRKKRKISKGKMPKMKVSKLINMRQDVCVKVSEGESDFYFNLTGGPKIMRGSVFFGYLWQFSLF